MKSSRDIERAPEVAVYEITASNGRRIRVTVIRVEVILEQGWPPNLLALAYALREPPDFLIEHVRYEVRVRYLVTGTTGPLFCRTLADWHTRRPEWRGSTHRLPDPPDA